MELCFYTFFFQEDHYSEDEKINIQYIEKIKSGTSRCFSRSNHQWGCKINSKGKIHFKRGIYGVSETIRQVNG